MNITTFLILTLANWRITNLLVDPDEAGPYDSLARLRAAAGVRFDAQGYPYGESLPGQILSCLWCCSVWVGLLLALGLLLAPKFTVKAALPFALSAGAILINRCLEGNGND